MVHAAPPPTVQDTFHIVKGLTNGGKLYITKGKNLAERTGNDLKFAPPKIIPLPDSLPVATQANPEIYLAGKPLLAPATLPKMPDAAVMNLKHYSQYQRLPGTIAQCLLLDSKNRLWLGTDNGLALWDGKKFAHFTTAQGLSNNYVLSLLEDRSGNIWIGTYGGGVNYLTPLQLPPKGGREAPLPTLQNGEGETMRWEIKVFTTAQGLSDNAVTQLAHDSAGNIWCGTGKGLFCFPQGGWPYSPHLNKSGEGLGGGAFSLPNGAGWGGAVFHKSEGLIYEDFNGPGNPMLFTKRSTPLGYGKPGEMWTGVGKVLTRYIPDYSPDTVLPSVYITQIEAGEKQTVWLRNSDLQGFENPEGLAPPPLQMERGPGGEAVPDTGWLQSAGIRWDGVNEPFPYWLPVNLSLPYNQNHLTFHFTASGRFNEMHDMRYRYIMQGLDERWSAIGSESKADYRNLPPGNYTFQVAARGRNYLWSRVAEVTFEVRPPWWQTVWAYTGYAVMAIVSVWLIVWFNGRRLRARAKELTEEVRKATATIVEQKRVVEEQKKVVVEAHKNTIESIEYASRIQKAVITSEEYISASLARTGNEFFVVYHPHSIVSGDFYWALEMEGAFYLVTADCTGHGVSGAFLSLLGISFMNEIVLERGISAPGDILNMLRAEIIKGLNPSGHHNIQDGMDMVLCRYDFGAMELHYAGANRGVWVVRGGEILEYAGNLMPVGVAPGHTETFTPGKITLQKGDMVYTFTDGIHDQFGGAKNKKLGRNGWRQMLLSASELSFNQQKEFLEKAFDKWKGAGEQTDDVTVVGIRI